MNIVLSTSQKQTITPQMIQTSNILQMSNIELEIFLQELSLENPLLDFESYSDESDKKIEWPGASDEQNRVYEKQDRQALSEPYNLNAMTETLEDDLMFQINDLNLTPCDKASLKYMVNSLEDSGYLTVPLEDIANSLNISNKKAMELLKLLQSLEPCGVGARNVMECLKLQLEKLYPNEVLAMKIVTDHLDLLAKNQLPLIARSMHCSAKEILDACNIIRGLNPRPGVPFGNRQYMSYIKPELVVVKFPGYFDILLNDSSLPSIHLNTFYSDMLNDGNTNEATEYLKSKRQELDQLSESMKYRSSTLLSLGKLIVERQQDFFFYGPGHLHTFIQSEAAELIGVHESVISRTLHSKYLQCQYGIFPLSYFFIHGKNDRERICRLITSYIDSEDKAHPYSDQRLSELLSSDGFSVSKRLVTKYRNSLGISSKSMRCVYK